jgi:hypothetical protein
VTYNFDPERWYDNERLAIEGDFQSGKLNARDYQAAIDDLDDRYDEMVARLDGTYQLPTQRSNDP